MLQDIRDRSTSWISKAIIGLIVVLLSFTGFEAIMSSTSNRNNAAKVNGEEISLDALAQEKSAQQRQLQQQFGSDFVANQVDDSLLTELAMKTLVNRKLMLQAADRAGFTGSSAIVDRFIVQFPDFQENGQFSSQRFDQVLRQMGYSRMQFRQMLEQDLLVGQLQGGIIASAFTTRLEAEQFARLDRQLRDFAVHTLNVGLDQIEVNDEQVRARYESQPDAYMTREQVVLDYIELSKLALASQIEVSEDELQEGYRLAIANLDEQRRAAHILFDLEQGEAAALEQARSVAERLAAGEDFAALARELSDDIGSADEGGDLGFAGRDIYEAEFEDALYALEQGEISEPVRTRYGFHLIKLLDINATEVPALEDMRDSLLADLRVSKVEQRFVEVVDQLENSAYESADLQQPAQELGLAVRQSPALGREGGEGIFANRKLLEAAFSEDVLEEGANSHVLELDADTAVVVRVHEHHKPERMPFESVAESITAQLKLELAAEQNLARGEALLAQLRDGSASVDAGWERHTAATRLEDDIDPEVLQAVFRMAHPEGDQPQFAGAALEDGSFVVLQLTAVTTAEDALGETGIAAYQQVLASRSGQAELDAVSRQLELDAKIEKF